MAWPAHGFLGRWLLHLLPHGFVRIRNFGFLAKRRREELGLLLPYPCASAAYLSTPTHTFLRSAVPSLPADFKDINRKNSADILNDQFLSVKSIVSMGPMKVMDGRSHDRELALTIAYARFPFFRHLRIGNAARSVTAPPVERLIVDPVGRF